MASNLKQTPIPVVPRNLKIVNADGTPTRSGQLLLQQLQPNNTIYGTSTDRPKPGDVPDGAIYVEFAGNDEILYQNQNGEWHYVAGTMWGMLNPDERPTDLGPNDAGFDFRSIDSDPLLTQREFIWSGTAWVETTIVQYGTHASRPATANAPARCLYVETDRSEVLYQAQATAWHFVAGTMWGTLSPDQRPTDLGVNDAGFHFRTTVDPPREFIWGGTAWVEVTGSGGVAVQVNNVLQGQATTINFFAGTGILLSGSFAAGTAQVTFATPSDMQLKRHVRPLIGGLYAIGSLRPVTAEWNGLAGTSEGKHLTSVIAQELQAIIPDAVSPYRAKLHPEDSEDVELLGLEPMAIISHLILAVQQLEKRLEALE